MLVNRLGRGITGMLQSAPLEVVVWEAGLRPAVSLLNDRQRKYNQRPLAAPRTQSTRDILSVTLREAEEQAQLGEHPVDKVAWTRHS